MIDSDLSDPWVFIEAHNEWMARRNTLEGEVPGEIWLKPSKKCDKALHIYWLCCPEHRLLLAESQILDIWGRYFDEKYKMNKKYGNFLSELWLEEFQKRISIWPLLDK